MLNDYELAATLNEKKVNNILNSWADDSLDLKSFNSLVKLGDSIELAMASVLNRKMRDNCNAEYEAAYNS